VEVRFVSETPQRTRVDLEHRKIDRHGGGSEQMPDSVGSPEGWNGGLHPGSQGQLGRARIALANIDQTAPAFQAAVKACLADLPAGAPDGPITETAAH
jgi:hypothetical protein